MKKKGVWIAILALVISLAGAAVALAVYLKQFGYFDSYDDMDDEWFDEDEDDYCLSDMDELDDVFPEEGIEELAEGVDPELS